MSDDTEEMEKYAVVEDDDSVKTAQEATRAGSNSDPDPDPDPDLESGKWVMTCPECGRELEVLTKVNVLKCPECGTKPFERRDERDGAK